MEIIDKYNNKYITDEKTLRIWKKKKHGCDEYDLKDCFVTDLEKNIGGFSLKISASGKNVATICVGKNEKEELESFYEDLFKKSKELVDTEDSAKKISYYIEKNRELERSKAERREEILEKLTKQTISCPSCGSLDIEYMTTETVGARDAKTKTVTKVNINPLKPLTVFESKEKIIRKAKKGTEIKQWHCRECGNLFATR